MNEPEVKWEDTIAWARVIAGCLIEQDGKYLLVQEKQPKVYGLWNLPAGHVDKGETIEAAAIREAREETGYEVELITKIGVYHEDITRPIKHAFSAKIVSGELKFPDDEILDAKWFSVEEIAELSKKGALRAPWILEVVSGPQPC
jgi:8-oxo-dGTP pyrophosphatase MutT (NUDIX family)